MENRLSELEERVESLSSTLRQVLERVTALELDESSDAAVVVTSAASSSEDPASLEKAAANVGDLSVAGTAPVSPPASPWRELFPDGLPLLRLVSLTGQACLILGGAFLLRSLTHAEVVPLTVGLCCGFGYALAWLVLAGLLGRSGRKYAATFYGGAAAMIAYPLIWEAATKLDVLSGAEAAIATAVVTALALGIAFWRSLAVLAWSVTILALVASTSLMIATRAVEPHVILLLVLGSATLWIAYGRGWSGLTWPAAFGVDLVVLFAVSLVARSEGPPESYRHVSSSIVLGLALSLPLVYLASFVVQTLLRKKEVRTFEMIQTGVALAIGLGGGAYTARETGLSTGWLGVATLGFAVASYVVAFFFTDLRWKRRGNFMYYAWLGLVLVVTGCSLVSGELAEQLLWSTLTVTAALLGMSFRRLTLHYHAAVYAIVGVVSSGLLISSIEVFLKPGAEPWPLPAIGLVAALAAAVVAYVIMGLGGIDPARLGSSRVPRLTVAIVAFLGAGTVVVILVYRTLAPESADVDAALLASIRTSVLAGFSVVLAIAGRARKYPELRWMLYTILVFTGVKLLVEDLPYGRPSTLFPAFALYGLALILATRLVGYLSRVDR